MNTWNKIILIGLVFLILSLAACAPAEDTVASPAESPSKEVVELSVEGLAPEVSVDEAYAMREAGAFMLDVREISEWNEGHIPGATLISLGVLEGRVDEVPSDIPIVVYCRSGNRSQVGRDILIQAGFTSVTSMSGGFNAWVAAGYDE
ncbi:MAG: hypothetical protein J7K85_00925 [Anaerolineaceae bacterium]|nr:hypothetical protein [Anaerolineaceae bacterium]